MSSICDLDKINLVCLPTNENFLSSTRINEEGEESTIKRVLGMDRLIPQVFEHLGYKEKAQENYFVKSMYSLEHGLTGIFRRKHVCFSCHGKFFLDGQAVDTLGKILSYVRDETGVYPHATEAHLSFTGDFTRDFDSYVKRLKHDWNPKKLLVQTFERNAEIETLMASCGVFGFVAYNKSRELLKTPRKKVETAKARLDYVKQYEEKYGSLQNQTRFEFRFRSRDILKKFSELMQSSKWHEAKHELLEQGLKRIELPSPLVKKFLKSL